MDQKTKIYSSLCKLHEKNEQSFYDVLDLIVDIFNKDQLKKIEDILKIDNDFIKNHFEVIKG